MPFHSLDVSCELAIYNKLCMELNWYIYSHCGYEFSQNEKGWRDCISKSKLDQMLVYSYKQ